VHPMKTSLKTGGQDCSPDPETQVRGKSFEVVRKNFA